jgi:hypothetical protein
LVEPPTYRYVQPDLVDVQIVIHEGQKYFFGKVNFVGPTIYGGKLCAGRSLICSGFLTLRGGWLISLGGSKLTTRPAVILRSRSTPSGIRILAINGQVPVRVTVDPGQVYYFRRRDGEKDAKLRPSYLVNRLKKFRDQPYSPERSTKVPRAHADGFV